MKKDIKQIKTMTGEELICEVLHVYDDEYTECMVIKNAPFMLHQDADQELVLNTANVLCITNPAIGVLEYFQKYIHNFKQIKMEDHIAERAPENDSDLDNLIRFPTDRMH